MQKTTRSFRGRGIVILSPIQITKSSYDAAMKRYEKEKGGSENGGSHYDLNAIRQYSELKEDMDLILTVWSTDEMKTNTEIEISCIKKRFGPQPKTERLFVDSSGFFTPTKRVKGTVLGNADDGKIEPIEGYDKGMDAVPLYRR